MDAEREAPDESSERYASMFTHHPHAAYSVDRHGYYTDANPLALAMTGLTLDEMRKTHFSQVILPEDLHLVQDGFDLAMTGVPQMVEARVLRSDGEVIDIRCTAIPVVVGGEVVGVHGITEDVSEAKRLMRQLEEANAAKTLFLATVSHEVRTPLAALVGATDLLMDSELAPEPEHFVQLVHRSSQRLAQLVDDILEFSGLEANRSILHPRQFEVRALVEDVADWAVPFAESRGLAISFTVDDCVPTSSVGDALRVKQVVTNLVQNAIKFTERGTVAVVVTDRASEPGTGVDFTIADTGIGITEEQLDTLFSPFTQADPFPTNGHRGVGLGLAICREIVDLMGGTLQVRSTLGEGSTFTFGVPLGHACQGAEAEEGQLRR